MDYYKVLGAAYDDPPQKIRARYRLLALAHHPDTNDINDTNGDHADEFIRYTQAYKVLGNPTRRKAYNLTLGITSPPRLLHSGYDIHARLDLSPEQAQQGGKFPVTFLRYEPCSLCWGTGCPRCESLGYLIEHASAEVPIVPETRRSLTVYLDGQGARREPGGTCGALLVRVYVQPT